jgi:hypothetical protein
MNPRNLAKFSRQKPLGVKFDGNEYFTQQDAKLAGERH